MPINGHFRDGHSKRQKYSNDVYEVVYWDHFAVVCFDASYSGTENKLGELNEKLYPIG